MFTDRYPEKSSKTSSMILRDMPRAAIEAKTTSKMTVRTQFLPEDLIVDYVVCMLHWLGAFQADFDAL